MSPTWAVTARPQRFDEVAGQAHIAPVLRAMVDSEHHARAGSDARGFPQALVLYGPRGTGKTTVARIIAKALNCQAPSEGEPCDACTTCEAIASGRAAGVEEIDMASHGSVEDIRQLKASASFSLAENWRVYLMDEVHSASREAFNALLKILEEPPPHTLFLLVTTEPDRIPDTIRSRCMEFEFRRLSVDVIIERLREVAYQHDVLDRVDAAVYALLAARSRGGMRDAVMSLEQVCYHEGLITPDTVRETFGFSDLPERLLDAALKGDLPRGLTTIAEAQSAALPPMPIVEAMLDGMVALLGAGAGLPPEPGRAVSAAFVTAYAGTSQATLLAGMKHLSDVRSRMAPGSATAPLTLSVGYSLLVPVLAPSLFAPGPLPAPGYVARPGVPAGIPPRSQVGPSEPPRTLSPAALRAALASPTPLTLEQLRKLETNGNGKH